MYGEARIVVTCSSAYLLYDLLKADRFSDRVKGKGESSQYHVSGNCLKYCMHVHKMMRVSVPRDPGEYIGRSAICETVAGDITSHFLFEFLQKLRVGCSQDGRGSPL